MSARGNVRLVRYHDDRIAFGVQPFKEVHDFHAGVGVECTGRFVSQQD